MKAPVHSVHVHVACVICAAVLMPSVYMKECILTKAKPGNVQCYFLKQEVLLLMMEISKRTGIELFSEKELLDSTSKQLDERAVTISMFGRYNSGKSTMINAILGNE